MGVRGSIDWRAINTAALLVTVINAGILLGVTRSGWLAGSAFPNPLGPHLVVYGVLSLVFTVIPLVAYAHVGRRSKLQASIVYLVWVLGFSVTSIPVLHWFVTCGIFVMRAPYSVGWDVTWGIGQYAVALGIYHCVPSVRR